jgi:hypothetical protein
MRLFTPTTARQTLDAVRTPAEVMARAWCSMEPLRPGKDALDGPVSPEYFRLAQVLIRSLETLQAAGVLVKDARGGLLDFPARREGRLVMLCWKVGETALAYWHEAEGGFAGRRRVDEDGPWEAAPAASRAESL